MPALEFLGRRWHVAADDLPVPSLIGALWHISILVLSCVDLAFTVEQLDTSCPYRSRHIVYLSSHVGCFVVNSMLHTWTLFESVRGTMFQVHRRRRVAPLILAAMFFYGLTIASNGYGTRLIYQQYSAPQCEPLPGRLRLNHYALTETIVVATWVSLSIGFLAMVITLNLFSTYRAASSPWLLRFQLYRMVCFCCLRSCGGDPEGEGSASGGRDSSTTGRNFSPVVMIANIFTHIFDGVDMVLTDYTAAFALLGVLHRHRKPALAYANARPPAWLSPASGSGSAAPAIPAGSWRAANGGPDLILQPPAVVQLAASSQSDGGRSDAAKPTHRHESAGPQQPGAAAAAGHHVVLELGPVVSEPAGLEQVATTITTAGPANTIAAAAAAAAPDAVVDGSCPAASFTTTSAPSSAAEVTAGVPAARCPAINGAETTSAASAVCPNGGCGELLPGCVGSVGEAARRAQVTRRDDDDDDDGRVGSCPLQEWGSGDLNPPNASLEVMEEALYYMRFATAVYGWKMFLWMNRLHVHNCCRLCWGRSCGCCRQSSYFIRPLGPDYGPSEGCCSASKLLEREAITQLTEVPDDDILYVCYQNRVGGLLPYYIALDRQRHSVVVGVRGSLSLSDMVTDLLCEPAEYDVPGVPSTDGTGRRVLWAHRGMLQSTRAILSDIREQGVLRAVVATWPEDEAAQQQLLRQLPSERARAVAQRLRGACSGYRLVITGHSLGAGVTGLLGPLLHREFPNLRCWAFAPPGGLMSPKAAELTHGFCISVTHAKDMIPRLGVQTMEALVQQLVWVSVHSRLNKLSVMGRLILLRERPSLEQVFLGEGQELKRELQVVTDKHHDRLKDTPRCKVAQQFDGARDFVPPGHMLYVERRKPQDVEPPCCSCNVCLLDGSARNASYVCRWIQVKDLMQAGLVVSRSMFLDHLPDNTMSAMQAAVLQMRGDASPPSLSGFGGWRSGGGGHSGNGSKRAKAPAVALTVLPAAGPDAAVQTGPV
ncbi:hypothetical protein PLESTF_001351700 [Pleodorina starrii]|nr:hypothetical protein PLESTF_001351700 [Pleodorina starrii]